MRRAASSTGGQFVLASVLAAFDIDSVRGGAIIFSGQQCNTPLPSGVVVQDLDSNAVIAGRYKYRHCDKRQRRRHRGQYDVSLPERDPDTLFGTPEQVFEAALVRMIR
ncbi:MAG: hypothetical protein ABIY55_11010 [Kofleriaceae bacterium]